MRDFYDLYTLYKLKIDEIDYEILKEAIEKTGSKRKSLEIFKEYKEIIEDIKNDKHLKDLWDVYVKENQYIGNLSFDIVVDALEELSEKIN